MGDEKTKEELSDAEFAALVRDANNWRSYIAEKYGPYEKFRNPQTGKIELPDDFHTPGSSW